MLLIDCSPEDLFASVARHLEQEETGVTFWQEIIWWLVLVQDLKIYYFYAILSKSDKMGSKQVIHWTRFHLVVETF